MSGAIEGVWSYRDGPAALEIDRLPDGDLSFLVADDVGTVASVRVPPERQGELLFALRGAAGFEDPAITQPQPPTRAGSGPGS